IEDANGNVVTSDSSTVVTFSKSSGTGTVSGLGNATASSGVATKTVTGVLSGSVTLTAHNGSVTDGTTTCADVAGTATQIAVTSSTANLTPRATRVIPAAIEDAAGNVVTTDNSTLVTFSKTTGTGTVSGLGNATASSGIATKTVTGVL